MCLREALSRATLYAMRTVCLRMLILFMPPKIGPPIQRSGRHELGFCSGTESARHHTQVLSECLRRIEMWFSCMTVEHVPSCGRSFVSVVDSELSDHPVLTSELVCDMHSVFHGDLQDVLCTHNLFLSSEREM